VTAYGTKYTGLSNGEELSQRLTEVMIRRRWKDVQHDLPPITRNTIVVDLTMQQRRKLDIVAESMRTSGATNTAASLARYRDALSIAKLPATVAQVEACLQSGEPAVVWTWHRDTAEQLVELLTAGGHDALLMTGDTPQNRRERIFEHWKSLPNAALVVTMAVAQVGIDLSHSHRPFFAEIDYTPAMIAQAEMRTFSPARAMNVTYVVADHYVDRKIVQALTRKLDAAEPVDLGTGEGAIASIDAAFRGPADTADMERFMRDLLAG
jgi:SNF2 family DNA or RNA helicase